MSVVNGIERAAENSRSRPQGWSCLNQTRSMVTVLIRTSFLGRSE
jgi:hypothetical protein